MKKSEMVRAPKHNNMTTWNSSNAFNYLFNQADIYQKEKQESETTTLPNKKKYLKQKYLQPLESASKVPATEEEEEDKRLREEFLELFNPSMEGAVQVPPYANDEKAIKKKKDKRWSLQEEIAMLFNTSLEGAFCRWEEGVSCSISPYPKEDGDYLCTSVLHVWPEIRKTHMYRGPTDAGLGVRENIMDFDYSDMIERCVVCGPGFLKFKLSRKWIAKSIHKMLKNGIDTWAPKLSVKKAIIYFLSRNIAEEMHTGHLRSFVIGETLARILEYSKVEVIRRYHEGDDLDVKLKMMTEFLIERFPNGEVNDEAIGELEALYKESKKRFDEDVEFRQRAQQSQGWDERHHIAWVKIFKISRECYQKVHQRLGVHVKEEGKSLHDSYISKTLDLLREKGFTIYSEGDDAIFIEGRKLFLVDLATLWYALDMVKADRIVHVTDVGQRDYIEMCISAAKHAGWIVNDHCSYPLSHVGFGLVEGDDFEKLVNLLDEAKSRCKAVLVGQGKAYEWTAEELEHTAEALGYAAVKYANLKDNRLTNSTINFDQVLNEKGNTAVYLQYTHAQICSIIKKYSADIKKLKKLKVEKVEDLILKSDEERLLGLHLLRFTEVLGEVCTVLMPHILCEYLFDLCNKFNTFHSSVCEVVGYGAESSKLLLFEATAVVMRKCFHLLGITPIYNKNKYQKEKESETATSVSKVPDKEEKIEPSKYRLRPVESQATSAVKVPDKEKMASFWKGPCFLFELCNVVLRHNIDARVENGSSYNQLRLFGTIQAETHISDPSHYGSFGIFNRNFDDPLVITKPGSLSPHDIQYCSLTASTFVKITAKLYGTTYKGRDEMESISDYTKYYLETGIPPEKLYGGITRKIDADEVRKRFAEYYEKGLFPPLEEEEEKNVYIDDDAFEVCDDYAFINFSECFADRPNGGSGSFKLKGKDGYLEVYYVALKHAAEALLEVDFVAPFKETKVIGRVIAYYGNDFCYGGSVDEKHLYKTMLFETEQPAEVKHGKLNLMRSVLAVPAKFSLIIDVKLSDFTSGDMIFWGIREFPVPVVDGSLSVGSIEGNDCTLNLKVYWKLPSV